MELTGCEGGGVNLNAPKAIMPGSAPEGWQTNPDTNNPFPLNAAHVELFQCDRISWGPFERGPLYIMTETHVNFTAPESCRQNRTFIDTVILESIWFSDAEVAAFANATFAMKAYFADFNSTFSPVGDVRHWTWTWALPGGQTSEISYYDSGQQINATENPVHREYWDNGPGVSYLEWSQTDSYNILNGVATGALHDPLLWGRSSPNPQYAAVTASREYDASASSNIARFADNQCLQPL